MGLDLRLPSDLVKGHLAATEPVSLTVPGSVAPLVTQIEEGRLLTGGTLDLDDTSGGVNPEIIDGIRRELLAAFPYWGPPASATNGAAGALITPTANP